MHRIVGSILIVAGTTIGAGMLAMPIISAKVGFGFMTLILFTIWLSMFYTSLLLVEVYKYNNPEDGLNTLTKKYLGKTGALFTAISMLSLMYALVSAYITGGGDILRSNLELWLEERVSNRVSGLLFVVLFGGLILFGTRLIDISTKIVFSIKIIFLCIVIGLLFPHIQAENLGQLPDNSLTVLTTIPVIFTSFGFYVVIPSLVKYLHGNTTQLKWVFLIGSLIPLVLYLIWELTILGNIDNNIFSEIVSEQSGLDGLIKAVRKISNSAIIKISFNIFAAAAILTSFWGVALSLNDYIKDLAKHKKYIRNNLTAILLTFIPPIAFAFYYPDGFIIALGYASVSLVVLALIMPMLLLRKALSFANKKLSFSRKFIFTLLWVLSFLIVALQILMSSGKIPGV